MFTQSCHSLFLKQSNEDVLVVLIFVIIVLIWSSTCSYLMKIGCSLCTHTHTFHTCKGCPLLRSGVNCNGHTKIIIFTLAQSSEQFFLSHGSHHSQFASCRAVVIFQKQKHVQRACGRMGVGAWPLKRIAHREQSLVEQKCFITLRNSSREYNEWQ